MMAYQSLKIHHSAFAKVVAVLLIISMTLLFIPFPIEAVWQPVQQGVDGFVEVLDQMDGHNNFTPGKNSNAPIAAKIYNAFGGN